MRWLEKLPLKRKKKVIETTAKKVGDIAGENIVSGIDKLVNRKNTSLNAKSRDVLKILNQPQDVSISNILKGSRQAIAIEEFTRKLNR